MPSSLSGAWIITSSQRRIKNKQVIQLYKTLVEKKEFVLSKQFLRSGTSIGANIHEAVASVSKRDFIHKLGIALKEARETSYWLNLLKDSEYIDNDDFNKLNNSI